MATGSGNRARVLHRPGSNQLHNASKQRTLALVPDSTERLRWWLWLFWFTAIWTFVYLAIYPGFGSFAGLTGWTQIGLDCPDRYPRSHDTIAFGAPSLITTTDGRLFASWWCTYASLTHCRWARIEAE